MSIAPPGFPLVRRHSDPGPGRPSAQPEPLPPTPPSPVLKAYGRRDRIPDPVYRLLLKAPKNEIHVHQGGSSNVEFLNYRLRAAIEENNAIYERKMANPKPVMSTAVNSWRNYLSFMQTAPWNWRALASKAAKPVHDYDAQLLKELPLFHPNGTMEKVRFTEPDGKPLPDEQLRNAMEKALTAGNLREYYRYQLEIDNHKLYKNSADLAETTATTDPSKEIVSATESEELQKQKDEGLQAYRMTSGKINPYVKNNPAAYKLANEYARSMAFDNVRYTEYRVSPSGNGIGGANGSNIENVLSAVNSGFEDARHYLNQRMYNLDYGLIVLFERQNRSKSEPQDAKVQRAIALAKDVVRLKKEGKYNICGVDLAGDEANNPVSEFQPAFQIIKDYNKTASPKDRLGITIHAGETPASKGPFHKLKGHDSISEAIRVAHDENTPVRIGHGLQIVNSSPALREAFEMYRQHPADWERRIDKKALLNSSPLLQKVINNNIVLEMCPKSNLQTYGIHPGFPNEKFTVRRDDYSAEAYSRHPAVFLSRLGVKVAISSDNRTISNTDVTNEFVKLFKYAGLTYQDFKQMVLNGFEGAFIADPTKKAAVMQDVENQFKRMEQDPEAKQAIQTMQRDRSNFEALSTPATFVAPSTAPATKHQSATESTVWGRMAKGMHTFRQTLNEWWLSMKNFFSRLWSKKQ